MKLRKISTHCLSPYFSHPQYLYLLSSFGCLIVNGTDAYFESDHS